MCVYCGRDDEDGGSDDVPVMMAPRDAGQLQLTSHSSSREQVWKQGSQQGKGGNVVGELGITQTDSSYYGLERDAALPWRRQQKGSAYRLLSWGSLQDMGCSPPFSFSLLAR